ncbi:MAG: hypothetical protein AAGD38_23650, partial [Acidobacteriota bacterium]
SVEAAICEFEDLPAPEREWFDVEVSLEIRRLYRGLRQEIAARPDSTLEERLRPVLYRLVAFREQRVYPFLRVDDRVYLRQLVRRILEWLNSDHQDPEEGKRLWEDLTSFTRILAQVSYRQELREHDRELVAKVHHALFGSRPALSRVPDWCFTDMEALLGLDDDLDVLVLARRARPLSVWRAPLERLLHSLRRKEEHTVSRLSASWWDE